MSKSSNSEARKWVGNVFHFLLLYAFVAVAPADLVSAIQSGRGGGGGSGCESVSTSAAESKGQNLHPAPAKVAKHHHFIEEQWQLSEGLTDLEKSSWTNSERVEASLFEYSCDHRTELLTNYSRDSSLFIECAVLHAKPVLFCEKCVDEYEKAQHSWCVIVNDGDCKGEILTSDRLQIVSSTQQFLVKLWHDGYCEMCYNESNHFKPKNSTNQFLFQYNATMDCFIAHCGNETLQDNSTLCTNCSEDYKALNAIYNKMSENEKCMDIIDLMNRTRMEWHSAKCKHHFPKAFPPVFALSIFFCTLPVFFYGVALLHGTKKQQKLVEQKAPRERRTMAASARLYAGTTDTLR